VHTKRILQLLISVTLLGILIYWIDLSRLWEIVINADPFYLGLAVIITTLNRILMAVKWNILLRAKGVQLSWYEVTRIYYTASFLGIFLPPTVGMDTVKVYRVSKKGSSVSDIISSIVMERLLGVIVLLVFGAMGGVIFLTMYTHVDFDIVRVLWLFVVLTIASVSIFLLSLSKSFSRFMLKVSGRIGKNGKYRQKATDKLEKIYRSYQLYSENRGTLMAFFGLTCLENMLPIVRPYLIAISMNAYVPLSFFFVIVPIELVLIRLPISFDGFGIREGIFFYFLTLIGLSGDVAFTVGLTNHLVFLVALLPGWVFFLSEGKQKEANAGLAHISA